MYHLCICLVFYIYFFAIYEHCTMYKEDFTPCSCHQGCFLTASPDETL